MHREMFGLLTWLLVRPSRALSRQLSDWMGPQGSGGSVPRLDACMLLSDWSELSVLLTGWSGS